MITGIGTDIVEIARIEKLLQQFPDKFTSRVFTKYEQEKAKGKTDKAAYYAKRFAAKEAILKATGLGFADGISWQDMEISNDDKGKPLVNISGKLAKIISDNHSVNLSLSDEKDYALAFVVIEL